MGPPSLSGPTKGSRIGPELPTTCGRSWQTGLPIIWRGWRSSLQKLGYNLMNNKIRALKVTDDSELNRLVGDIAHIVEQARGQVRQTVNSAMVECYWQVGRLIVEHEQQGQARAEYGRRQLEYLSERLKSLFGKGFDPTNLNNMRGFYRCFPILDAVRQELSWTHYRSLIRLENPRAREWYMQEG